MQLGQKVLQQYFTITKAQRSMAEKKPCSVALGKEIALKRFIAALLCVLLALSMSLSVFAAGDPNIDTGGGGLGNGSAGNVWYGDSGVRVSIVNADTKTVAATPVDYIKEPRYVLSWYESTLVHFGKTCKLRYNAGAPHVPRREQPRRDHRPADLPKNTKRNHTESRFQSSVQENSINRTDTLFR